MDNRDDIKAFSGIMNTDDSEEVFPQNHHGLAYNLRFRGSGNDLRAENIKGTTQISFTKPAGINKRKGHYYHPKSKRIFWFYFNSNTNHSIYIYSTVTKTVVPLIISNTNTIGDVLGFTINGDITSINIIDGDDDTLYYVDSLRRPTYINVNKALSGAYGVIKRSFLDVAKSPAIKPPQVVYENDLNVSVNNLRNYLFQFCYRPVYINLDKPVWSSGSTVPLPNGIQDASVVSNNARIAVYIETGDSDVKEIEIAVRQATDKIVNDWERVVKLNKAELGIADNSIYRYVFYNDGVYTTIPSEGSLDTQTLELQDYVPRETSAQEVLNGNVLVYGNIKEGFNKVVVDATALIERSDIPVKTYNGLLFFAYQTAPNKIVVLISGTGTNDVNDNVTTLNNSWADFHVKVTSDDFADLSFTYSNGTASTLTSSIINALKAAAVARGFTVDATTTNTFTLSYPSTVRLQSAYYLRTAAYTNFPADTTFAFVPDSRQSFSIEYFDDKGRTNGVSYAAKWDISTPTYNSTTVGIFLNVPKVTLYIHHRPPVWAAYYHIVRSDNGTYGKRLYWVSNNAVSDNSGVANVSGTRFAYIDVSNIALYSESIASKSDSTLGYEFQKGDRIRFMARFDNANLRTDFIKSFDYEIVGVSQSQNVNGKILNGTFLKIMYPESDINADFKFDGSSSFTNYYILIYNYKKRDNNTNRTYYEFGKQYLIGNKGTLLAYHIGDEQTQSVNLATPAQITLTQGDSFFRQRAVPKGGKYYFNNRTFEFYDTSADSNYAVMPLEINGSPIVATYGTIQNQTAKYGSITAGVYPTSSDIGMVYHNTSAVTVRMRVKFNYTSDTDQDESIGFIAKVVNNPSPNPAAVVTNLSSNLFVKENVGAVAGVVDNYIDVYAGSKVFIMAYKSNLFSDSLLTYTDIEIEIINNVTIPVFEETFSDTYQIRFNSNSRATVIDEDAKEINNTSLIRWGLAYQPNTNINQSNRFLPNNFDQLDNGKGAISRMRVLGNSLKIFQTRGTCKHGIYTRFIQDSAGNETLATTNEIITSRNARYYLGEHGMGEIQTNLISSPNADYFVDYVTGEQIRLSEDGYTPLTSLYKGQFYIASLFPSYNKTWARPNAEVAKIFGCFDTREGECITVLQGGTNGSDTIGDYAFAFNEKRNAYSAFFNYLVEGMICAEDMLYSWANDGSFYIHNNTTQRNYFHGVQYKSSVVLYFNKPEVQKKSWLSITQNANYVWLAPLIYTQTNSYGTQRQESALIEGDFADEAGQIRAIEGQFQAAFLKDIHSIDGIINGEDLKGTWIAIKLESTNSDKFVFLAKVTVKFADSPRTV